MRPVMNSLLRTLARHKRGCICRRASIVASNGNVSTNQARETWVFSSHVKPDIDMKYIMKNVDAIAHNISQRKGDADVYKVVELWKELKKLEKKQANEEGFHLLQEKLRETEEQFLQFACALPNDTHPETPKNETDEARLVEEVGAKRIADFHLKDHSELGEHLNIIRTKNLGHITGHRSYYLRGSGAQLEKALVRYTLDRLINRHGFQLISVPDIIRPVVFEGCGMRTKGLHTQVYKLDPNYHQDDLCLAGTAEVGIAGYLMNRVFNLDQLPLRIAAVSRCFRAETAHSAEARGLFRVHQFTKVEMFGVSAVETGHESEEMFHEFVAIQRDLFKDMGLHFQILDMPAHDLGSPAYRKYDIEAWMPGRCNYGEISSASNCTDYQSRRLKIKYCQNGMPQSESAYVHTLNGTACAVPRLIIAILENFQNKDGSVNIPEVLQPFMYGQKVIEKPSTGYLHYTRL